MDEPKMKDARNAISRRRIDVGKIEWEVKDDFLSPEEFEKTRKIIMGSDLPWNYSYNVAAATPEEEMYFMHMFYMGLTDKPAYDDDGNMVPPEKSPYYGAIEPIIEKIPHQILLKIKANLYVKTENRVHHPSHVDTVFPSKAAIFYLNTNDGFTVLEDGTEIASVANRILIFDPTEPHHSTTCTDNKRRVNININYL